MKDKRVPPADDDEPVSKRTRRSGVVASIGDPKLTDRSKVAPLFLTKKEKEEKKYKKEQEKLVESTKTRMNDWKSVIGVEKDASKVCPVFQKASVVSSLPPPNTLNRSSIATSVQAEQVVLIPPLVDTRIVPNPYASLYTHSGVGLLARSITQIEFDEGLADSSLHRSLVPEKSVAVDLSTPCKPPSVDASWSGVPENQYPEIDKPLQTACIAALIAMSQGKVPCESAAQLSDWTASNTRDWCSARVEPRRQHALAKWLAKWKDEDTAVKRNRLAPILLVTGPVGSGKTSLVYAAAAELKMQVLEVSPADFSWQANRKRPIDDAVKEALQSRKVNSGDSSGGSQIVLIDDVDVLVKEDKSVINSIATITDDSKRPLVLTCTNGSVIIDSVVDVSQVFDIESPDHLTCSFLVHAYQVILSGGTRGIPRSEADLTAKHVKGDLRRIAVSAEMRSIVPDKQNPRCVLPSDVYGLEFDTDFLNDHHRLLRCMDRHLDYPLALRSSHDPDILTCMYHMLRPDGDLSKWLSVMEHLCVADTERVIPEIGVGNALSSISMYSQKFSDFFSFDRWTDALMPRRRAPATSRFRPLIEPFTSDSFYLCSNRYRAGIALHHLGVLAQPSTASTFTSRRVKCFLDQSGGNASDEINQLRILFPNNQK